MKKKYIMKKLALRIEKKIYNEKTCFADSIVGDYKKIETNQNPDTLNYGPVLFSQLPLPDDTNANGPFSDAGTGHKCFDNFWDINEPIWDLHWWGLCGYGAGEPQPGSVFEITFCLDDGGIPDYANPSYVFTGALGTEISFTGTGNYYWTYELFYFEMDLPSAVSMSEGWVSVQKTTINAQTYAMIDSWDGDMQAYQLGGGLLIPYDLAFELTGASGPPPMVVEKYVLCPCNEEWIDADTEEEALDLPICTDATFKIVIRNDGDCPLFEIAVYDMMHDSLEYLSADPEPDEFSYDPPNYYIYWFFPGPLNPGETIEIYITAHVNGPHCSIDYNFVEVTALCDDIPVSDSDYAYVHAFENEPPNKPIIDGPLKGEVDVEYCWTFKSTDPNGDPIRFEIDWGDGSTDATDCYPSGTEVEVCHTYTEQATYTITAVPIDCCWGAEGPEGTLEVEMPVNQQVVINPLLQMILERFPNAFPILRHLLGL